MNDAPPSEPARSGAWPRRWRPWRLAGALAELALAGLAVWAAFWCWGHVVGTVTVRLRSGVELVSRTYAGDWAAAAIGVGGVAAVLVAAAVRQAVLGVPVPRRLPRRRGQQAGEPTGAS